MIYHWFGVQQNGGGVVNLKPHKSNGEVFE